MKNLIRALFLVALLAPQGALVALSTNAPCEEARGCCAPDGGCDTNCTLCVRCAGRAPSLNPFAIAEPVLGSPRLAIAAASIFPPQPQPTDIFHVPKSS